MTRRRTIRAAGVPAALALLALAVALSCSGDSDDTKQADAATATSTATSASTLAPTPSATAAPRTQTPTAAPTTAPTPAGPTAFTFANDVITFEYGTEWRPSAETAQSVTLTLKELAGEALLTVKWQPHAEGVDTEALFLQQLGVAARELAQLTDGSVGGAEAHRYAALLGEGASAAMALIVVFSSADVAYLVTFVSPVDGFGAYAPRAAELMESIALR